MAGSSSQSCRMSLRMYASPPGDRKARTREELETIIKEPLKAAPTREVWMHESLVDDAHRLWEEMVADLKRKPSAGCPRPLGPSTDAATRS